MVLDGCCMWCVQYWRVSSKCYFLKKIQSKANSKNKKAPRDWNKQSRWCKICANLLLLCFFLHSFRKHISSTFFRWTFFCSLETNLSHSERQFKWCQHHAHTHRPSAEYWSVPQNVCDQFVFENEIRKCVSILRRRLNKFNII